MFCSVTDIFCQQILPCKADLSLIRILEATDQFGKC